MRTRRCVSPKDPAQPHAELRSVRIAHSPKDHVYLRVAKQPCVRPAHNGPRAALRSFARTRRQRSRENACAVPPARIDFEVVLLK